METQKIALHWLTEEVRATYPENILKGSRGSGLDNTYAFREYAPDVICTHWQATETDKELFLEIANKLVNAEHVPGLLFHQTAANSTTAVWYYFTLEGKKIDFGINRPLAWDILKQYCPQA